MSSRREQKEQLRRERLAREAAAASAAARRKRLRLGGGAAIAAAVIAAIVLIAASGGGKSGAGGRESLSSGSLVAGPAPWAPEYSKLAQRLSALDLPSPSDSAFHIHAMLRIYVNGKQEPVPANIGIDPQGRFLAPLHTHDATGILHIESEKPYPFTLGEFFDVWGVKFTPTQIGSYRDGARGALRTYVNGKPIANPTRYVMKAHDNIVVGYGKRGSFPTNPPASFPGGL